jgi:hypothetical protein
MRFPNLSPLKADLYGPGTRNTRSAIRRERCSPTDGVRGQTSAPAPDMARQHVLEQRHAGHDAQGQTGVAVSAERMRHCLGARQTNARFRDLLGVLDARSPATRATRLSDEPQVD